MKYIFPVYCDTIPQVNGQWADSRCCSVMALVHAFGISFEEAQKHTAEFGRKVHEGMALDDLILMLYAKFSVHMGVTYGGTDRSWLFNDIHFNIHEEYPKSKKGCTLETFMKNNPTGRYIVFLKGHVTVVSEGKLLDYNRQVGAKRVYYVMQVKSA